MKHKNIFILLWTLLVSGFLVWVFISTSKDNGERQKTVNARFDRAMIDSLVCEYEYILLVVASDGCTPCQDILPELNNFQKNNIYPYYLNADMDGYNLFLSMALRNKSFPTSYLIDKNGNIVSVISGAADYHNRIMQSITDNCLGKNDSTEQNSLSMLDYGLKGLFYFTEGDNQGAILNLRKSRSHGSYFFNNYLLSRVESADSSKFYANEAINSLNGSDWHIYNSLIQPMKKMLEDEK